MRRTLAISANLSLYPRHNLTHSFPNALSSGHSLNNSSRVGRGPEKEVV